MIYRASASKNEAITAGCWHGLAVKGVQFVGAGSARSVWIADSIGGRSARLSVLLDLRNVWSVTARNNRASVASLKTRPCKPTRGGGLDLSPMIVTMTRERSVVFRGGPVQSAATNHLASFARRILISASHPDYTTLCRCR